MTSYGSCCLAHVWTECYVLCAGTTYSEFIKMMQLPSQLAHVDPIVASFCGGAVGVLSAFMVVEANNAKAQEKRRCQYCEVKAKKHAFI